MLFYNLNYEGQQCSKTGGYYLPASFAYPLAQLGALPYVREETLRGRRVYIKQMADEAILYYLGHGLPSEQG